MLVGYFHSFSNSALVRVEGGVGEALNREPDYIYKDFVAVWNLFTMPLLSKKLLYEQGMRQQSEGKAEEIRLERTGSRKFGSLFRCHQWCVSVPVIFHQVSLILKFNEMRPDCPTLLRLTPSDPTQHAARGNISLNANLALFSQENGRDTGQSRITHVHCDLGRLFKFKPSWHVHLLWFVL